MCKTPNRPVMVGLSTEQHRAVVFRPDCDQWTCADCAEKLRKLWTARIAFGTQYLMQKGRAVNFITVTSHERLKTFAACYAVFPHAWGKLYAAMKRVDVAMAYALIPEKHKDGRMHVHLITDCPVTKRWMKDNARRRGLGYEADVQPVESEGHAAAYCSKYLGKGLGEADLPPHFRRVRLSQNWQDLPVLHEPSDAYDWLVCSTSSSLWAACEECQRQGMAMVDLENGEVFDFTDMVERIAEEYKQ